MERKEVVRVVFWSIVILLDILVIAYWILYFIMVIKSNKRDSLRLQCYSAYMRWIEAGEHGDKEWQEAFAKIAIERIEQLKLLERKKDRPAMDFIIESIQNNR